MRENNPKNITRKDIISLTQISLCGFVRIEDGIGWCESGWKIGSGRLERLRKMGFLEPAGDSMFGVPSQTWRLTRGTEVKKISCGPLVKRDTDQRRQKV